MNCTVFSPCGTYLVCGTGAGTLHVWKFPSEANREESDYEIPAHAAQLQAHGSAIYALAFAQTQSGLLLLSSADEEIRGWRWDAILAAAAKPSIEPVLRLINPQTALRRGGLGQLSETSALAVDASAGRLRVAVSRSHTPEWVERFAAAMDAELVPAGSVGNKVCMLLTGEADLYVHQIGLKEWDTCAPECVARSLGWHVSKLRGEAHTYNREDPRNHELVVCPPALEERVLAAVAASGALDA